MKITDHWSILKVEDDDRLCFDIFLFISLFLPTDEQINFKI